MRRMYVTFALGALILSGCANKSATKIIEADRAKRGEKSVTDLTPANIATAAPVSAADAKNAKKFTVEGGNYTFTPAEIRVRKGDVVAITFKNKEGFHDLRIDDLGVYTPRIGTGMEQTITFKADKTGSFEYYCSVGNHRAQGMKGTLIVE